MHMADALLSPAVGGTMCAVSAGTIIYCSHKVRTEFDERKTPLMGVLGAFIFAAQMINFSIPATGSSGHLGGGLILSILLGPHAAFLVIASVLVVQALFFADGGLLALGCNIFNLGFFPAFIAYPFIYRKLVGERRGRSRITVAAISAATAGLTLGAFAVVLETVASGVSALPFATFVTLMLPIHLAIGVVEGVVTATVIYLVATARPEMLLRTLDSTPAGVRYVRSAAVSFLVVALLTGGVFSWFASASPDGLEWSISRLTGKEEIKGPEQGVHGVAAALQEKLAVFPDYTFKKPAEADTGRESGRNRESISPGTSVAGITGGLITLALAFLSGFLLKSVPRR